ncbi:MAG: hypothetical protein AAF366_20450 [Pseudomonadota bacterium]
MIDPSPVRASARLLSRILLAIQVLLGVLALAVLVGGVLAVLIATVRETLGTAFVDAMGVTDISPQAGQVLGLAALVFIQVAMLFAVTGRMRAIFVALERLRPEEAAGAARGTAWWLWALVIWGVLAGALGSVITTWHLPDGERALAVGIGSQQITTALAALFAAFMARALTLGAALWRDHRAMI